MKQALTALFEPLHKRNVMIDDGGREEKTLQKNSRLKMGTYGCLSIDMLGYLRDLSAGYRGRLSATDARYERIAASHLSRMGKPLQHARNFND